jgi:RNA polymerase sigma factor (sigma-70 family)
MSEIKLIEQYQNNKDSLIRDELYERKRVALERLTIKLVSEMFPKLCLEKQDFFSYTYLSFIKCLETFNTKQRRYTFNQALMTINRSMIIRYGSRLLQVGHQVLNTAYRMETRPDACADNVEETNVHQMIDDELMIEKIMKFCKRYPVIYQKIIKLKLEGYSNEEISKMLHVKTKTVANKYSSICKKYRKHCI